jgi:hypothetical protein
MVGIQTSSGVRVSAPRDAPRIRVQGRKIGGTSRTEYRAVVGGTMPRLRSDRALSAPHVKLYSEVLWNHDRQRMERREIYVDRENDYYKQEWFSLETGETTWGPKEGKLSDPGMHGKSARRAREQ